MSNEVSYASESNSNGCYCLLATHDTHSSVTQSQMIPTLSSSLNGTHRLVRETLKEFSSIE